MFLTIYYEARVSYKEIIISFIKLIWFLKNSIVA